MDWKEFAKKMCRDPVRLCPRFADAFPIMLGACQAEEQREGKRRIAQERLGQLKHSFVAKLLQPVNAMTLYQEIPHFLTGKRPHPDQ